VSHVRAAGDPDEQASNRERLRPGDQSARWRTCDRPRFAGVARHARRRRDGGAWDEWCRLPPTRSPPVSDPRALTSLPPAPTWARGANLTRRDTTRLGRRTQG